MSFNLIESTHHIFNNELISNAANFLGESNEGTTKGVSAIIPSLVSGLASKVSTSDGAVMVEKLVQLYQQSGVLNNAGSLIGNNNSDLISKATGDLHNLFGNKSDILANEVANYSGIKQSSSATLLSMALPAVLGSLAIHTENNPSGVTSIAFALSQQSQHIANSIPPGFTAAHVLGNSGSRMASTVTGSSIFAGGNAPETVAEKSGSALKWLIPALICILIAIISWYCYQNWYSKKPTPMVATTTSDSSSVNKDSLNNNSNTAIGKVDSLTGDFIYNEGDTVTISLPNNGGSLTIGKNSTEDKLVTFLTDSTASLDTVKGNWFEFTNVHFKSGTATLTPGSMTQLKNMATIFKAFPAAQFKIGGYTDSTGDAAMNEKLSQQRADLVAATITKLGAPASSIVGAKGYGKEWPLADNTTIEGRAMNRRVAVNVKAK